MALVDALVMTGAILNASVGVMQQALAAVALARRHPQRVRFLLGLQALVYVPARDLARVRIRDPAEIDKLLGRGQVGDVSRSDLLGRR